jgi:hypothetical protein
VAVKLHLGVVDVPYGASTAAATKRGSKARPPTPTGRVTTGDVAQILEARYGVVSKFMDLHGQEVADELAGAMQDRLETLLMGGPSPAAGDAILPEGSLGTVEKLFRNMLDKRELDGQIPGVPTAASLRGVSHRMQNPYAQRGSRPSFIDTGQYQDAFRVWVD